MVLASPVAALLANPLLLLFVVVAVGYPLGRVRLRGFSLGIAGVLFAGLAAGAVHPDLKLPELIYQLGLVLFVYTVGLANGAAFFASFRRQGLRDAGFVAILLVAAAAVVGLAARLLGLSGAAAAGLFAGSLTNTPALAAVLEALRHAPVSAAQTADPVVAYSVAYPMGVVGMLVAIVVAERWFRVDYREEAGRTRGGAVADGRLASRTVEVQRAVGRRVKDLIREQAWDVVFGRRKRAGALALVDGDDVLLEGDLVTLVGPPAELDRAQAVLGRASADQLELNREEMDSRFAVVSSHAAVGRRLRDLALPERFGALVTRVRRGDVELVPRSETVLELGDQARVLARRVDLPSVGRFFGDSYRELRELDVLTFSLGLGLGLLVGMVAVPLPAGITVRLGLAGGPLVVALILGALRRTGSMVWTLPHSANQTLRQLGLIFFLAGVGTRAGDAFLSTLRQGAGARLFATGAAITALVAGATLWAGYRWLLIPMARLTGMLSGLQTQPAVLAFAQERSGDDEPSVAYAGIYPIAIVLKIVLAQILLALV
jgi:putative transport protein